MKHNLKKSTASSAKNRQRISGHLKTVNLYAAGIDIGSEFHFVAIGHKGHGKDIKGHKNMALQGYLWVNRSNLGSESTSG